MHPCFEDDTCALDYTIQNAYGECVILRPEIIGIELTGKMLVFHSDPNGGTTWCDPTFAHSVAAMRWPGLKVVELDAAGLNECRQRP
jgi:hypothetical protein